MTLDASFWKRQKSVIGVGLISGTSLDGVDTVIVELHKDRRIPPKTLFFKTIPYPDDLRKKLLFASAPPGGNAETVTRLNWAVGHALADAAQQAIKESGLGADNIQFIGSHGQTIQHVPNAENIAGFPSSGTLQIGEPAVIAAKTGKVVIADFRANDMAYGGEGAPLVPWFDHAYFAHPAQNRVLLNIGGIANFTWLPKRCSLEDVVAFDSGPGNMIIDALLKKYFDLPYDQDGQKAALGEPNSLLLAELKKHPYFSRPWPKSTGREEFGEKYVAALCKKAENAGISPIDLIASTAQLTADTIVESVLRCAGQAKVDEIFVSGGGANNATLMKMLARQLPQTTLKKFDDTGVAGDAKEAVCFAALAWAALCREPGNIPRATGAAKNVVLGKICLP